MTDKEKELAKKEKKLLEKEEKLARKLRKQEEKKLKKEQKKENKKKKIYAKKHRNFKERLKRVFTKQGITMMSLLFVAMAMFSVIMYRYSIIADLRYEINSANRKIQEIDNEIKVEKTKIDEASRSDIIEKKAIEKLNMTYRNSQQIEYVTVD